MNKSATELENVSQFLLDRAKKRGASQVEVHATIDSGFTATVRLNEPEEMIYSKDKSIELTVYFGKRQATVSSNDTTQIALEQLVEKACSISKYTDEDPHCGLADASLMAVDFPDLDVYHPWALGAPEAFDLASRCEAAALAEDKRLTNSEGAWVETSESYHCYANSNNFLYVEPSTSHSFGVSMIAKQQDEMEKNYDFTRAISHEDLLDVDVVGRKAAQKTVGRLGGRTLKTQRAPVIFKAEVAKGLISTFISAISGGSLYRKTSFLLDSLNQKVFPDFFHLYEDPYLKRGLGSASFDMDGLQTRKKDIVRQGVVNSYLLGTYSSRQLGMQSTANAGGVFNVMLESHDISFDDLVKEMGTGLLVTELMGQGVNLVTGNYSRGASGFWVENGEIQFPVHEITIASKLQDMYKNIISIANDADNRGNIRAGSMLISEMMIAGAG